MPTADNPAAELRAVADRMRTSGDPFLAAVADLLDYASIDADLHSARYPTVVRGLAVARAYLQEQR